VSYHHQTIKGGWQRPARLPQEHESDDEYNRNAHQPKKDRHLKYSKCSLLGNRQRTDKFPTSARVQAPCTAIAKPKEKKPGNRAGLLTIW